MTLETQRLHLRKITTDDAPFYFELFNDPDWIQFINDKGLKSIEETKNYLEKEFIPKICTNELGFFTVFEKETNQPIGASSILKRDTLEYIDIGYGFLPKGRGKGYATEATQRIIRYAKEDLKLKKIVALTKPDNKNSQKLLLKIGFIFLGNQAIFTENDSIFELNFN